MELSPLQTAFRDRTVDLLIHRRSPLPPEPKLPHRSNNYSDQNRGEGWCCCGISGEHVVWIFLKFSSVITFITFSFWLCHWSGLNPSVATTAFENTERIYLWCLQAKRSRIIFQHFVIQVAWQNTRLWHLSLALYSDCDRTFSQSQLYESACCYWLLYAVLLNDRWRRFKLTGCLNKRCALRRRIGLWRLDKISCRRHRQLAWVELRQTSWHHYNLTLKERATINKNSRSKRGRGGVQRSCFLWEFNATASLMSRHCLPQLYLPPKDIYSV